MTDHAEDSSSLTVTLGCTASGDPLLNVAGELDISTHSTLAAAFKDLLRSGTERVVVDLAEVPFIDSSGLSALLTPRRAGAELVVQNPSPRVRALLDLVGVPGIIAVQDPTTAGDGAAD